MHIAYFINQYPKVSHSFVRREIRALERLGMKVTRMALRATPDQLIDPHDIQEMGKTRLVLQETKPAILRHIATAFKQHPRGWLAALALAMKTGWGSQRGILLHFVYFVEACIISQWMRKQRIEHVHAHFGTNSTTVVMLARAMGGPPYSFTAHGPDEFDMPEFISLGEKIKRSAFTVGISSFGRSQLLRRIPYEHWHKVVIVHCGLEKDFSSGEIPPVADVPRLVCVGRLCEQKGQMLLIDAMRQLFDEGLQFELVLAGDGPMRADVETRIRELDLEAHVRITGWISSEQVREELLAARALVLPSFAEGLPVVIMEAMALKRPVITTYIAGIPELVEPGKNGWLFPAGTVPPLKKAIADCLQTPIETLRQMGEKARKDAMLRHDIDKEAEKLLAHFEQPPLGTAERHPATSPKTPLATTGPVPDKPDHLAAE